MENLLKDICIYMHVVLLLYRRSYVIIVPDVCIRENLYMRMFNSYLGAFGDIPVRCSFCYKKFKCLSFYENTFVANIRRINLMLFLGNRSIWEAPI